MPYAFTGDPAVDAQLLANLQQQSGQNYYRSKNALSEQLNARGFLGGGLEQAGIEGLLQQRSGNEMNASLQANLAAAERFTRQREQEQALQNQMRLYEYQAKLGRGRKMSAMQRALMGAGTGAAMGSAAGPWGALGGGLLGAGAGYFSE